MSQIPSAPQEPPPPPAPQGPVPLPPGQGQVPPGQVPPSYGAPPGAAQGQPAGGYGYATAVGEMAPPQQRLWACLAHLSSLLTALVLSSATAGIVPFGFLGPLVVYLVLKDRGVFIRRQAAEALNFQLLVAVVWLAVVVLGGLFTLVTLGIGAVIAVPLAVALGVVAVVLQIIAAVRANQGIDYRYPVNWRLVK